MTTPASNNATGYPDSGVLASFSYFCADKSDCIVGVNFSCNLGV